MKVFHLLIFIPFMICMHSCSPAGESTKLKALIIDGSNNHYVWPKTTLMIKDYLQETDLFEVSIARMDTVWLGIKYNSSRDKPLDYYINEFPIDQTQRPVSTDPLEESKVHINFQEYDLVVSNLGAFSPDWSDETKASFAHYIRNGGGLVIVHAANNAWGDWDAYNEMIGLGAWGGRDRTSGPFVYYDEHGKIIQDPTGQICGSHGKEHEYLVKAREPNHPILEGLPTEWLHAQDELYDRMRGPFKNTTILATAYSDTEINEQPWEPVLPGTGQHVPVLMTIHYGEGKIFHTTMGHFDYSMECVGFITTLQRGAEWAATGQVTQPIPKDFPSSDKTSARKWSAKNKHEH
jgi:hypothetical protein